MLKYYVVDKSKSKFMAVLGKILFFNPDFMTRYVTTIGRTIYCPNGKISPTTLEHELQHVRDYDRWGLLFALSYLLALPTGWTMRAYWERKAYAITIRKAFAEDPARVESPEYRAWIVRIFTGPDYFWMSWSKKSVEKWFDNVVAEVKRD